MYDAALTNLTTSKEKLETARRERDQYYQGVAATEIAYANFINDMHAKGQMLDTDAGLFAENPTAATEALRRAIEVQNAKPYSEPEIDKPMSDMIDMIEANYSPKDQRAYDAAYAAADAEYIAAEQTMERYNRADYAMATGNYEEAYELLTEGTAAYWDALEEGKEITADQRASRVTASFSSRLPTILNIRILLSRFFTTFLL